MSHIVRIAVAVALAAMSIAGMSGATLAAPLGSIEGYVHTDNGSPINGAHVLAYNWDTEMVAGEADTIEDGTYSIGGLALAKYRVKAEAPRYLPEYYREGTPAWVIVTPPYATDNIDFTLTQGSSISGRVCQADGRTPINGASVVAYKDVGGAWDYAGDSYADSNGLYTVTFGTGAGTYRLKAQAAGYAAEYYDNVSDPVESTDIQVTAGGHVGRVTFALTQVGFISGTVYKADGLTPIPSAHVVAYDDATGNWAGEGFSEARAGTYYINLSPGTYRLKAEADGYLAEWYADVTAYAAAAPVSVVGLNEGSDINFTLETAMAVSTFPAAVSTTSARLNGNLTSLGAASDVTVSFVWRTSTGQYTHEMPGTVRDSTGFFSFDLGGLVPGTTYYYKAKTVGDGNPVYGEEVEFTTTDAIAPVISRVRCETTAVTATITWTTDEEATSQIDYGLTEDYESSTGQDPSLVTSFSVNLCDLSPDSIYHYRIICRDASKNKAVSADYTFTTDVYYGGMAKPTWKMIGFAVVAVVGVAACFVWAKTK